MYNKYSKKIFFVARTRQHYMRCFADDIRGTNIDYVIDDYITYITYRRIRIFSIKNLYLITFFAYKTL